MSSEPAPAGFQVTHDPELDRTLVRAFLESVPDAVYFKDRDSRFIAVSRSKARRHACAPAQMVGLNDADFFAEEHAQWARVDEEEIMSTGEPILGQLQKTIWPDGRTGWSRTSKMPLRDEGGEMIGTLGISHDITDAQHLQLALEKARRELVDASRRAGMAEVATGVLHNVGNVLTSLNVSANMIAASLHQSKAESLAKLAALLAEHSGDLGEFLANDPKGRRVPEFLDTLAQHALAERDRLLAELGSLQSNIDHIKEIVSMQQAYATMVGVVEPLDAAVLMEDAIRMNAGAFVRHQVSIVREFYPVPKVTGEKAKVLQILVNLLRNAKYACDESGRPDKAMVLRIEARDDRVRLVVQDNGVGIAPEHLEKIFQHGFTTRAEGHGFGLRSSAAAARDMQGALLVQSEGRDKGATFTLELPVAN